MWRKRKVAEFEDDLPATESKVSQLSSIQSQETLDSKTDLFVVGDSKQSIYRFRSADVTVFHQVQSDIQSSGGELIDLDLTFRAHKPLLEQIKVTLNDSKPPIWRRILAIEFYENSIASL